MAEYLYPGVYVVEVEGNVRPIEGVSTSTADLLGEELLVRLVERAKRLSPEWTHFNNHDPGVTLLNLSAWLAEAALCRMDRPGAAAPAAARLAMVAFRALLDGESTGTRPELKIRFYERAVVDEEKDPGPDKCVVLQEAPSRR